MARSVFIPTENFLQLVEIYTWWNDVPKSITPTASMTSCIEKKTNELLKSVKDQFDNIDRVDVTTGGAVFMEVQVDGCICAVQVEPMDV